MKLLVVHNFVAFCFQTGYSQFKTTEYSNNKKGCGKRITKPFLLVFSFLPLFFFH